MSLSRYAIIGAAVVTAAAIGAGTWIGLASDDSDAATPMPNLTVELQQYRVDEPRHQVRMIVSSNEPAPITVVSAQLASPDFELVRPEQHDSEIPPGGSIKVALQTTYGQGICDGEVRRTARPAMARLWVQSSDREIAEFEFPLDDRHGYLDTLLRRDCELQKINSSVELVFGDTWEDVTTDDGKAAVHNRAQLTLMDPAATVDLLQMVGSVIFNLNGVPASEPLAHLDATTRQTEVVIEFTNNRCDLHAVGESSHSYLFQFWFSVDGSEPISRTFSPDDIQPLRRLIDRGCGLVGD